MIETKDSLRDIIGDYMLTLGANDSRVVVVNADLMMTCRNKCFVEKYPDRSFNVGVAEQNMVSFSAGLAHEGLIPYAFSMAPFISMRACEQCRTDVAYGNLNVRLISTYAGVSGGISGATHWGIEDCAIMSGIPSMTVIELSDAYQAKHMLGKSLEYNGAIYFRTGIEKVKRLYNKSCKFSIGKAAVPVNGNDGTIICSGVVVQYAIEASAIIRKEINKNIRVVDMHTIKPIDREAVLDALQTGVILVAQDHNVIGGLGQQVATIIAESGVAVKFKILGIPDEFCAMAHAAFLYKKFGYDTDGLIKAIMHMIA